MTNYRLDIQEDLSEISELIPELQSFYSEITTAAKMHHEAYARDYNGHIIRDQYGRYVFARWENLPQSFAKIDKAINEFANVLSKTKSAGMKEVLEFLNKIQDHPTYKAWTQYAGQVYDGGRYFIAFDYEPADGSKVAIQLGKVLPHSTIDTLLSTSASIDGTIPISNLLAEGNGMIVKRLTGIIRNEFGHLMQELTGLNFDGVEGFCKTLVSGMEEQLSFYAALGNMYEQWKEIGIPICRPTFTGKDGIQIKYTVHPTIAALAKKDTNNFTLNDFTANKESNGVIVTGPNDGGKTASGKGFALSIVFAQAGIRVPARQFEMQTLVHEIYTHFILKEDVEDRKGRHKNELTRARRLCEVITNQDFLLYDEPCGGTDVKIGLIDSTNLLRYAWQVGVPFIFATHIHELAEIVEQNQFPGIRNMQAEIIDDDGELNLTHKIISGRAKESYGSRISAEVGVTQKALNELLHEREKR